MKLLLNFMMDKIQTASLEQEPYQHIYIENFLPEDIAYQLSLEFLSENDENWHSYKNSIEDKKTCNQWNLFKPQTYKYFQLINSPLFCKSISDKFEIKLISDAGLHGGGQHFHGRSGNLNPHLDYSIHPKLGLERRINIIYYLSDDFHDADGGHFGMWGNESATSPGALIKEIAPKFNRAVIFNTSQNSWHGMSRKYNPSGQKFRKSLASYYLSEPREGVSTRSRALFAPRTEQIDSADINELIRKRSDENLHKDVYKSEIGS